MYTPTRTAAIQYPDADKDRASNQYIRRTFLEGTWDGLLAAHGTAQLGPLRARLVGEWDIASNLQKSIAEQTCTMYDEVPQVTPAALADLVDAGGYWAIARQNQQYVRVCHENAVYVGWDPDWRVPTYELVPADQITVDTAPYNRTRPVTVWRAVRRVLDGELVWTWDRWSVADIPVGAGASYRIMSNDRRVDLTARFPAEAEYARARPAVLDEDGRPLLPYVVYHDRGPASGYWSPACRDREVTFGTLQVGLLFTAAVHGVLRASWSQRILSNGRVKGGTTEQIVGTAVRMVTPDPTMILQVEGDGVAWGEWGSPLDIEKSERFARIYEARLAVHYGIPPSDLVIESLNPASGASIVVSQAGKRAIAKRDAVNFRRADTALFAVTAAIARAYGVPAAARGAKARYSGVALTIEERVRLSPIVIAEIGAGLLDRAEGYAELHPGMSVEDATDAILAATKREDALEALDPPDPAPVDPAPVAPSDAADPADPPDPADPAES